MLGFFAPTLLRLAVAGVLIALATNTYLHADRLKGLHLPLIGVQRWIPLTASIAELLLAAMFLFGWHTQIAAILGLLLVVKYFVYRTFWPHVREAYLPPSVSTMLLVAVICLSLLISGAGALGFDLPL